MNGNLGKSSESFGRNDCAPAYSLIRDVSSLATLKNDQPIGRYTVLSKTVSRRNGNSKGIYQPSTNHYATLDSTRRAQSQQNFERNYVMNTSQSVRNGFKESNNINNISCKSSNESTIVNGGDQLLNKLVDTKHYKSHSVTSTFVLRDSNNRSAGGSLSCGQPSPSSTTEDSIVSAFSPNSARTENRSHHQSFWLHHSEISLPTGRDLGIARTNGISIVCPEKRTISVTGLESDSQVSSAGSQTITDSREPYYNSSSSMLYENSVNRNKTDDYLGSYALGPSHRKIQNLHSTGGAQRRYPSDTTLNFPQRDGSQVYTSGSKPGPVTIPARSRSAQPSPGPSPMASPTTFFRNPDSNLASDFGQDKRSRITRSQQLIDLQHAGGQRGRSSPSSQDRPKLNSYGQNSTEDDVESPILPSVREIIRQVEAMTQSNAATSTTDISNVGLGSSGQSGIPRYQRGQSISTSDHFARGGILRQIGSSQRTPSAPQLRAVQYTPMQAKFNSMTASAAQNRNAAPPVPPHGPTRSQAIIGSFTRRSDPMQHDSFVQSQRFEPNSNTSVAKKTELLSNLPTDYQKLREAFIEQRREIQRLRKQLADKDVLISQLQSDIRLYEPWR